MAHHKGKQISVTPISEGTEATDVPDALTAVKKIYIELGVEVDKT